MTRGINHLALDELAELIGEAAFAGRDEFLGVRVREARSGKAGRLVRGFRGPPAADAATLADLVLRLARLGEELPAVAELDLNPVIALSDRCAAVDARVRVRRPEQHARAKTCSAELRLCRSAIGGRTDGRPRRRSEHGGMRDVFDRGGEDARRGLGVLERHAPFDDAGRAGRFARFR